MELFPAIDLRDGKAVRLVQGDYNQMTVFSDPAGRRRRWDSRSRARKTCMWSIWTARKTRRWQILTR